MQPATIRSSVYHRCEFKEQEQALYPDLTHPRTIEALTHASVAASTAVTHTPEQAQARQAIKDCERRLARYQAGLEAGADPAVVTQ
ncbi:hypothetical protein ACFV7R_46390 [Streptomyces sp. NPDC059866]|uniref:hypothetical protein n=1 Tax=Streptomyces sp. NPDC059866 TaxID=3346978 RepID=UPI0036562E5D